MYAAAEILISVLSPVGLARSALSSQSAQQTSALTKVSRIHRVVCTSLEYISS